MSEEKVPSNYFPLSVKLAWLVTFIGALGIAWLSGAWVMETLSYARYFFQKIHAVLIFLTSLFFIFYCFKVLKGFRTGKFQTRSIQFFEMATYCFLVVSSLVSLIMFAELLSSERGDFRTVSKHCSYHCFSVWSFL